MSSQKKSQTSEKRELDGTDDDSSLAVDEERAVAGGGDVDPVPAPERSTRRPRRSLKKTQ